ncbi:MAG: MBL fold metallo-hydrolase [bacterium]
MRITFWGAARTTTGSMHMLGIDEHKILLDCGLYQGRREESRQRNLNFSFSPKAIHSVVLSHAHIDHCGNLPTLVARGFEGNIYCTTSTEDLVRPMLLDSAHIQEKDVEFVNKKRNKRGEPLIEPLYTTPDAESALHHFVGLGYHRPFHLLRDVRVTFHDAGHILGSAVTSLDYKNNGSERRLVFSGDIGRKNLPILRDPEIPEKANFLIMESTYGNRLHSPIEKAKEEVREVVERVYRRGGKIIVPSFAVGRTQELVYCLNQLWSEGRLPRLPVFVDSPLAVNVTEVFRNHPECFDKETKQFVLENEDPFGFASLTYIRSVDRSKALNQRREPCIIISASGMCEAGRILHHLKNSIEDPKNCVLIVGYQAMNTLGRRIVERQPEVKIFGEPHPLRAEVKVLDSFSAHADADELMEFARLTKQNGDLKKVFVVHGEEEGAMTLAKRIREEIGVETHVPNPGDSFDL